MTQEEQARIDEFNASFTDPANVALMENLVAGFNHLYDTEGLNVIVQVHSHEDATGQSWSAYIEDNHSFPGKIIRATVKPDGTYTPAELIEPDVTI